MCAVTPSGSSTVKSTKSCPSGIGRAFHLVGGTGVVAQRRRNAAHVAERFLHRLADVERLQKREALGFGFQRVGQLEQQPAALGRRDVGATRRASARCAACTAASISAAPPRATSPITSSVLGSIVSKRRAAGGLRPGAVDEVRIRDRALQVVARRSCPSLLEAALRDALDEVSLQEEEQQQARHAEHGHAAMAML